MKNLTLIKTDDVCCYYLPHEELDEELRKLVLKAYVNEDGKALRMLNVFPKNLVWRFIRNNIVEMYQPRIVALNNIPLDERPAYLGRLLMVRRVDKFPFDCILSGENIVFSNGDLLNFGQAVETTKEWVQEKEQYSNIIPAHFVFALRQNALTVSDILNAYFSLKELELVSFRINLGIEIDEESGKVIPVWIGEGINFQTAEIREKGGGSIEKDTSCLAEKILPKTVYKKQVGESG